MGKLNEAHEPVSIGESLAVAFAWTTLAGVWLLAAGYVITRTLGITDKGEMALFIAPTATLGALARGRWVSERAVSLFL